ncbi:nucleobase:cation symporter-2 family protein [Allostreptomyces psammosilenae]|uniref:NCS2 family nucleobase:cation symporter-2 n=1 Tax=Allostreptomyces psammosilenae TaxID=1892865 RepID=A0A852ZNX6_9ACTN|nr:nucleobase:cation symporter-2 family protein [Allostreptomyces psammosilenae]NYI04156.1 NCS2 family nucleobase:cation symporter-2 [Allostreptomyces psammosilenae]
MSTVDSSPPTAPGGTTATGAKHPVDQVPPVSRLFVLGLQHVLAMYTGCVTVPLVFGAAVGLDTSTIGLLINADLLVAGIVTVIQSLGVGRLLGVRLPVVAGATFAAVSPMILIGNEYGMPALYGAMLVAGVFGLALAVPFARVVRFFPPLVSGTVVTVIGLSLIGVSGGLIVGNDPEAADYASPRNLALAAGIVVVIVAISRWGRGLVAQLAVLIGLVLGTLVALPMGLTDFSTVGDAAWIGLAAPFHFGPPEFHVAAIVAMCTVMLVIFTESTADMLAVADMTGRRLSRADLARGLAADGLSGLLAGSMNSFLDTAFAQNVGLVEMSRVRSRFVVTAAGVMLFLLGLVPKLGEVVASLPAPVVGGAGLVMFATVTAVGIRTLRTVSFENNSNLLIIAVSIGVGMLPEAAPDIYSNLPREVETIAGSAITSTVIVAFTLNLLFNHGPGSRLRDDGTAKAATPPAGPAAPTDGRAEGGAGHGGADAAPTPTTSAAGS